MIDLTELSNGQGRPDQPYTPTYLCPGCGAVLSSLAGECPRCGMQFDEEARKAQIEQRLRQQTGAYPPHTAPSAPAAAPHADGTESAVAPPAIPAGKSAAKALAVIGACLFVLLIMAAILSAVGGSGYNTSPEKLVEGLARAYEDKDTELLLSLVPPEERENYSDTYSSASFFMRDIKLVDVVKGKNEQMAFILIDYRYQNTISSSSPDLFRSTILVARAIDGEWYLDSTTILGY